MKRLFLITLCIFGVSITTSRYPYDAKLPHPDLRHGLLTPKITPNADQDLAEPLPQYARRLGYPAQTHEVTTPDGYILQLFRIQSKYQKGFQSKKVVLLWHPLLADADLWVLNYEAKAPGFILANQGYDVWFGNVRGNRYSQKHATLDPEADATAYWNFTWQQHAELDLPTTVAYIANLTGRNMDYLGHSQGSLMMLAGLAAEIPVLQQRIEKIALIGPIAYLGHSYSPGVSWFLKSLAKPLFDLFGMNRFLPFSDQVNRLMGQVCDFIGPLCVEAMFVASPDEPRFADPTLMPKVGSHMPSGTSSKNMVHFGQMMSAQTPVLQKFDYGTPEENLKVYGQPTPPVYDLTKITKKIHLLSGAADTLSAAADVRQLHADLPDSEMKEYPNIAHVSFVIGKDVSYFQDVLAILDGQQNVLTPKN